MWHMPLDDDYKDYLKSAFADLPNIGGRWGGAITAAKFLEEFVEEKPWVHLDIAGTAWLDEAKPDGKGPVGRARADFCAFGDELELAPTRRKDVSYCDFATAQQRDCYCLSVRIAPESIRRRDAHELAFRIDNPELLATVRQTERLFFI